MTDVQQRTDGELLGEYAATGSQAAFAELVNRHAAMVQAVAWRVLADHHEAQDVTQAVFVTLARKAKSLRRDVSAGGWLHRVAWCLARDVSASRQSRQQRETDAMEQTPLAKLPEVDHRALRAELDGSIEQLPERYRRPLVLFHLEGQTLQQTATQLGLNPATAGTRLARARELLRKKLVRRGVTVGSVGALADLLSAESGAAVLPATFVAATVKAATGGTVSTTVAALSKGALHMLFIAKIKTVSLAAAACLVVAGTGVVVAKQVTGTATPSVPVANQPQLPATGSPTTQPSSPLTAPTTNSQPAVVAPAATGTVRAMVVHGFDGISKGVSENWITAEVNKSGARNAYGDTGWLPLTDAEQELYSSMMGGRLIKARCVSPSQQLFKVYITGFKITPPRGPVTLKPGEQKVVQLTHYPGTSNVYLALEATDEKPAAPVIEPGVFTLRVTRLTGGHGIGTAFHYVVVTAIESLPAGATEPKVGDKLTIALPNTDQNLKVFLPDNPAMQRSNCRVNLVRHREFPKVPNSKWMYRFPNDFPATNLGDCQETPVPETRDAASGITVKAEWSQIIAYAADKRRIWAAERECLTTSLTIENGRVIAQPGNATYDLQTGKRLD